MCGICAGGLERKGENKHQPKTGGLQAVNLGDEGDKSNMSKNSGEKPRGKLTPRRLAGKIKQIRLDLGLTQAQIWLLVNPEQAAHNRSRISHFERGERIPSLRETRNYARLRGIPVEVLADDALEIEDGSGAKTGETS